MKELMKANGYVDSLTAELGVNGVLTPLTEVNVISYAKSPKLYKKNLAKQ